MIGYLQSLAIKEKAVYARLLEKIIPLQLHVADKPNDKMTPLQAVARLKERGIPVPLGLLQLAHGTNYERNGTAGYEAELGEVDHAEVSDAEATE